MERWVFSCQALCFFEGGRYGGLLLRRSTTALRPSRTLFETLEVLGKEKTVARIGDAIRKL